MDNLMETTVDDILNQGFLPHSIVYSGKKGLTNKVKWTHIIESEKFIYTLNGGELILTTGIGIDKWAGAKLNFIQKLMDKNVSAICIELDTVFQDVPTDIVNFSETNSIPIILFTKSVKFVDITHDIHKYIINNQYFIQTQLYNLSKKFNKLALKPNGIQKILKEIFANYHTKVFFIQNKKKPIYFPPEAKNESENIYYYIQQHKIDEPLILINNNYFIISEIHSSNLLSGYLCLQIDYNMKEVNFIHTVLEQASLAISQIVLRNEIMEERKRYKEDEIVNDLLNGELKKVNILDTLLPFSFKNVNFRVIVIIMNSNYQMMDDSYEVKEFKTRISSLIRKVMNMKNLAPIISIRGNQLRVISFSQIEKNTIEKYNSFLTFIRQDKEFNALVHNNYYIGIGKIYNDFSLIPQSYWEAKQVTELNLNHITKVDLFEELGIYEILVNIENKDQILSFINVGTTE